MAGRVLVAGIGNLFLGDDGFGPEVARRLAAHPEVPDGVDVVDYGIRGMHLAHDVLEGYDTLVMIDTVPASVSADRDQPGHILVLEVGQDDISTGDFDPHGMAPAAALANIDMLGGELPFTYVVGCVPQSVDENLGLTETVEAALPEAIATTLELLSERVVV